MQQRRLLPNQKVIIIFDNRIGFVKESAKFISYKGIIIDNVSHEIPVFLCKNQEILGTECFWVLESDVKNDKQIEKFQKELISLQISVLEIAEQEGYKIPQKVMNKQINQIAHQNTQRMQSLIDKFGFDPRDESWVEQELAETERECQWFQFERENGLVFIPNWDDIVLAYNQSYGDKISIEDAKRLSKKRMRYLMGAYYTRLSGNKDKDDWKKAAKDFERFHFKRENRMRSWSVLHEGRYPLVRVKKPINFWPGPYFHQCIEKIPHVFTTYQCNYIKEGIVLRVVSYDKEYHYMRLDFTADIRALLKPDENNDVKPWIKDGADYDMWIKQEETGTHLEILENLS